MTAGPYGLSRLSGLREFCLKVAARGLERILAEGDYTGDRDQNNPAEEENLTRVN